ncbi:MAG TPA: tetratricopeptide repeat protein [Steroidobacteraceae bacterium]|nr:tetratricopeptide repeat protein [Steroidobacteraceae bacterium]
MMPHTSRRFTALSCLLLAACAQLPHKPDAPPPEAAPAAAPVASAPAAPKGESELLMAAQMALRNGDCHAASQNMLAAAMVSREANIASRAAQTAFGCHQLDIARSAAARWRELDALNGQAALAAALVALKRYDLKESREALAAWRDSGASGTQDPLQFAESLGQETDPTALYRVFTDVLVGDDPAAEVLLAQAQLAFSAQNMQAARLAAQHALLLDSSLTEARLIDLRAQSVLGDHDAAIAGARQLDPKSLSGDDVYLLADLLDAADREDEAAAELQRLAAQPETRAGAEQRLFAMALRNGDLDQAEQHLAVLMSDRANTALAVLYFAQLAERRGDDARAVQSYRLLGDSGMGLTARTAAARLMIKHGDSSDALALLDEYAQQNPDAALDAGTARATLLADAGDLKSALAVLDALDKQYPGDPVLQYTRATVLETGGRTSDAVAQFESAVKQRPDDPELLNALGFTLADHKLRLSHAEDLIRSALAVSPDNPAIQDSLGWVLYQRGKASQAVPVLARAWQNSGDPEIAAHYGEVLWKTGAQGQALYVWQQALNSDPSAGDLRATMKRLTGEDAAPL